MKSIHPNIITSAPPRIIHVTITEEDRQKAGKFSDHCSCILATALKRMGYGVIGEGVDNSVIRVPNSCMRYNHARWEHADAHANYGERPFYAPEVVGKTIILTRDE